MGCCEDGNEQSGSIKNEDFFTRYATINLSTTLMKKVNT